MAQVINTNIASLNAQRNLNKSQITMNTSLPDEITQAMTRGVAASCWWTLWR